jgi:hypothetical protein
MAEIRLKSTGTIKLFENDNTSNVTIASPASLGGDRTVTLPDANVTLASGTMLATDGSGASLTALNASELGSGTVPTARLGSGTASSSTVLYGDQTYKAEPGGGLTAASQWRLTTSFTGDAAPIATNLEECDTFGAGVLGGSMTESSGIFTFPSTGFWLIMFELQQYDTGGIRFCGGELYVTLDNSNYNFVSQCYGNLHNDSSYVYSHTNLSYILDVTSTSLVKVKFHAQVIDAGVGTEGDTDNNRTSMTFIRLADT